MRKILFIVAFLILVYRISAFGSNVFYADFTLTNKEYGSGAAFPCKVWFNGNTGQMRVDYFSPNGTKFMSQYYNYVTDDKYQVCSDGKCTRATWTATIPLFLGNSSNYVALSSCENPDYPGPKACSNYPACASFKAQPTQPQGIYSLSYFDTTNYKLCLVRWNAAPGFTYGPEWHITNYVTSGFTSAQDPTQSSIYQSVIDSAGGSCPAPVCFAELDISLVIDESGSIFAASAWNDVQSFVKNLISAMDIKTDGSGVRMSLTYFSGLDNCYQNWSVSSGAFSCPGGSDCGKCGGRWQQLTTGVISSKDALIKAVNKNTGAGGYTCISCGIDVGIKQLNVNPKANVQKLIILFTDGAQNRVTNTLALQGKIAYDQNIKIIAIGSGAYKIEDLQTFATTIYSTSTFSQLTSIINQIITPLCQPLPNVDTCDFCSGLCSCSTTCNCPTCNDYNACTTERCDPRQPPDGTAGICVSIPVICDDSNPCTINNCINTTTSGSGCDYSQPTPLPSNLTNTFCKRYNCSNPQGFVLGDVGSTVCPAGTDKCIINYCNTTVGTTLVNGQNLQGSCVQINRTSPSYPSGTVINYVNSLGQNLTTSGCGRPSNAIACQVYSCNSVDGSCIQNNLGCVCLQNSDCNDGDGCTIDVCDTVLNKCNYTTIDCWANLSGNNCKNGGNTAVSTATGDSFYAGTGSFPLDGTGLPSPNNVTRTCDLLACYNGQRSSYTCKSQSNSSYVCQRQINNCQSAACSDTSCRSLGNWTLGQFNTDCGKTIARTCTDSNLCTSDVCNSTWVGTSCLASGSCATTTGGNRCIFNSNSTNCNDGSVCTSDSCIPATGCKYTTLPLPPSNPCFNVGCNAASGNFSNVNPSACTTNANKCIITYCNTTNTGSPCQTIDRTTLLQSQTVVYVDAYGQTQSVTGCAKTDACRVFGCNSTTGLCTIDSSACGCTFVGDPKCDDGNGCTNDTCNVSLGQCQYTLIDCYSELSNGGCITNQAGIGVVNTEGQANFAAGSPDNAFVAATGATTYTCDKLSCYSGIRSTYTCQSTGNLTHSCVRAKTPCPKGGCLDTICTTLGTWTNGQLNTDCSTTSVPVCTSDFCHISQCDVNSVYGGNRCTVTSNSSNCDDNNLCTVNQCFNNSGCDYNTLTPQPSPNTNCTLYTCTPANGWQASDRGISQCTNLPANACQVTYCNTTLNMCIKLDRSTIPVGTTVTYVDSAGVTQSLSGCQNPGDPLLCKSYSCDPTSGQCQTSTAACRCINDASCSDGDGCTIDKCDIQNNQCLRTRIDCFSILSNGSCPTGSSFTADVNTGLIIYNGTVPNPNNYTQVDANGLPFPSTGVVRTCGQLGCYNGQPSQYSCFSVTEGSYTCQRIFVNCSRNGCQDNICRTNGTWSSDNQINSDCGTIYRPFCADNNACTNDFCNTNWKPTDPVEQRCLHTPINATQFCNDGNFCTDDYCDNQDTTGDVCKHRLYDVSYLKKNICKNATSVCQTVKCTVNKCVYGDVTCLPPTLCIFFTCNATTKGVCGQYPTGLFKIDKCGICAGNGLSCVPSNPGNPKKTSIAVALGVGLGVGLACAAIIIFILSKRSYDYYNALASETLGTVTTAPTYQDAGHYINTTDYNHN